MPEEKEQDKNLIDVGDADEKATEIDLDKKTEGGTVEDDKSNQDDNKSDDTPEKLDESVDVRDSSDNKEPEKKEEVKEEKKNTEQKQEMDEYSDGVKKRIAKLTRKMREAERQREEAVTYAKRIMQERDQLSSQAVNYEKDYTTEMEGRISSSLAAAQAKLATSREADDKKAEVEALTAISQLGYEQGKLAEIKSRQKMEETAAKEKPQVQQPVQQRPAAPDPKAEDWADKNDWFGRDNAMTYTAFDLHRKLTEEEGFDPKSDSYYEEIDKRIRLEFPQKFGKVTQTISKPTQNVASATRSSKTGRKTVKLTSSQVAIAKKLRVPLEEYARQLQLTKEE